MNLDKLLQTLDVLSESKALPVPKVPTGGLVSDKKEKMGFIKSLKKDLDDPLKETTKRIANSWEEFQLNEYGPVGTTGMRSQGMPVTGQNIDPAKKQQALDQAQIQKSTQQLSSELSQQGTAQPFNKQKFQDVMSKLDITPNTNMSSSDSAQMSQVANATSKILQNPQTAAQYKQLITKADALDQNKEKAVKTAQAQQASATNTQSTVGTNKPAAVGDNTINTESYDEDIDYYLAEMRKSGYDL